MGEDTDPQRNDHCRIQGADDPFVGPVRDLRRNNLSKPRSQTSSLQDHESVSHSVVSNSLRPRGLKPAGLLSSRNSPGKNTKVGSYSFLQGIFLTQGSNPGLPHCRQILYQTSLNYPLFKLPRLWYFVRAAVTN